jgi:hypothetical protein
MGTQVVIDIGSAMICFMATCYPALVGANTPTGEFTFEPYKTNKAGYGGTILVFKEQTNEVYAVHRAFNDSRRRQLKKGTEERKTITKGCVNIDDAAYKKLFSCCSRAKLIIK